MRVTENSHYGQIRENLERMKEKMDRSAYMAGTQKKLLNPSDDPVGVVKVLEMRNEKADTRQYLTNARYAQSYLESTDTALKDLSEIFSRLKELALSQSTTPAHSPEARQGVAQEVHQLWNMAIMTGNRKIADRYLFSGYKITTPALDAQGNYLGDAGKMDVEIAKDAFLTMNLSGDEVFFLRPDRDLARAPETAPEAWGLLDEIQHFEISLLTGDMQNIRSSLERFDAMHAKIIALRSKIGSRLRGLEKNVNYLDTQSIHNAQLASHIEDADMAQVLSDLSKQEALYRNALASSKRLVHPNLLDFIK